MNGVGQSKGSGRSYRVDELTRSLPNVRPLHRMTGFRAQATSSHAPPPSASHSPSHNPPPSTSHSPSHTPHIVVTSNEAYLEDRELLTASGRFIRNAINWLKPHPDDWVGVCGLGNLRDILCESGIEAKNMSSYDGTVGGFCRDAYTDSQADELLEFVRQGGGLLIGGQAWWWSYKNPGSDVQTSFPGSKLTGAKLLTFDNALDTLQ